MIYSLTSTKGSFEMSMPSISIEPDSSSTILENAMKMVDFPAPVRPTTPTFSPGAILRVKPFSTLSVFGLYLKKISLNSTSPFKGHPDGV